ncbi:MAG: diguanylate cyclase [Planctomycetota bacterium]
MAEFIKADMEKPLDTQVDYKAAGREVDVKLLRALAMGNRRSVEIQLLLDSQADGQANYQALSLLLTDRSVEEQRARMTFEYLRAHQYRMRQSLGRSVGIKIAAMDYLENIEMALGLKEEEQILTYSQLTQMALRDHLTGLANFRHFMRRFNEETKRAERYRHLLSVIMIDIDFFKQFNDTHGHIAGNKALEHLAEILRSEVRETDVVARYGGEEFCIILPETTKAEAGQLAERVRRRVQTSLVELADGGLQKLTISLGVATYPRDARPAEALLASADDALYASKEGGRNRVSVFSPPTFARLTYMPEPVQVVNTVHVVGDFNGWNKSVDLLQKDSQGIFSLDVHLTSGRYVYKFIINGEIFIADPLCQETVADGYGGRNSVLMVK